MEKLYSVEDLAKYFGTHVMTIRRWIYDGKITSFKVGRKVRVTETELQKFIENSKKGVA